MSSSSAIQMRSEPQPSDRASRRDFLILGGVLLLFLVGLVGVVAATGWAETWAQLSKLGTVQIVLLLALSLVNYIARGSRWHLFARRLGLPLPLATNLTHFFGGFAMSITPGRIGELIRLRWITKLSDWRVERVSPLPLVDRAFDLAGMGLLLVAGLLMSQAGGTNSAVAVAALAIVSALIVTRPVLLHGIITGIWKIAGRWPRVFVRLRSAASAMSVFSSAVTALPGLALSFAAWLAECYALFLLLTWLGAPLDLATVVVIFIVSTLAGGLTGAPGGIGGAEAAMVFLLGLNGVPLEVAVPATAVIRLTTLWFAIFLGLIFFPIAESSARTGLQGT